MKNRLDMKYRRSAVLLALMLALMLALPLSASATGLSPGEGSYNEMQVEYRYVEGDTPDIPNTIDAGGLSYQLTSQTSPVLESTLPTTRTYTWRIDGAVTLEQLESVKGIGDIELTPVDVVKEREVDKETTFQMETNDVDDVPEYYDFTVTSGSDGSGTETKALKRAGVTFTVNEKLTGVNAGLPSGYTATVLYRGIETYKEVGYYTATSTFRTTETDGEDNVYIIVATYRTEAYGGAIIEEEEEPLDDEPVEEEAAVTANISDEDVALIAGQGSNPLKNLIEGLVPIGNIHATGVWSFLSCLMSVAAVIIAIVTVVKILMNRRHAKVVSALGEYDKESESKLKKQGKILQILTIVAGLFTLCTWLMLDDMSFGMTWFSFSTIPVAVLLIFTIVCRVFVSGLEIKQYKQDVEEEESIIA